MVEDGLRIVHRLKDTDAEMKWLAELFPLEIVEAHSSFVPREISVPRLCDWCALHPSDMRALAHLGKLLKEESLLERAALGGDALAMGMCAETSSPTNRHFQFARTAAEKGDSTGAYYLARFVGYGMAGCYVDRMLFLWRAADLGSHAAYRELLGLRLFPIEGMKLVTSFFLSVSLDVFQYEETLSKALHCFANDGSCADAIFEAGELLKGVVDPVERKVLGRQRSVTQVLILQKAVKMYDCWCDIAREACVAWIMVARRMNFNKDARKMIAMMVWEMRDEARGDISL